MNSRRRISTAKLRSEHCIRWSSYFDRGLKTIVAVHSQCLSWVLAVRKRNLIWS